MAGWPAGALVPSSPKVRLGLASVGARARLTAPALARLAFKVSIDQQAGKQSATAYSVWNSTHKSPPTARITAMGELPGLEVPFVSRGLPHRIRLMASSTHVESVHPRRLNDPIRGCRA